MASLNPDRGNDLIEGARVLRSGPAWLVRLIGVRADALLERIDAGLETGRISVTLPDGSRRTLGGRSPGFDAVVDLRSWRALLRMATAGSIGAYQGWEAGDWASPDPVQLLALFVANADALGDTGRAHGPWRWLGRLLNLLRRNNRAGARRNIHAHYDLGNDFYSAWLDPELVYSSARFDGTGRNLAVAQQRKLDTIVERIAGAGFVLEIGCGWGALAQRCHDAGMAVTAISLSDEQLAYARAHRAVGIDFRNQDYRDVTGQFDAIVSVEMVEAVGRAYWPDFFDCLARCLKPGGRAAIQYIAIRDELFPAYAASADFIQAYIFPGGMLISEAAFRRLAAARGLGWEDQACFGADYAETLRLWREAFDRAAAQSRLPAGFDDRFVGLWRFYLMYCEAGFRGGGIDVRQVTITRPL